MNSEADGDGRGSGTRTTTAFVLSGGASLGSIQVGMAQALDEAGITPDLIVGTSVGAMNGTWLADGGDLDDLAEVWHRLNRNTLFPVRPLVGIRAVTGRLHHLVPDSGLRKLITEHISFERLEEAAVPLAVLATDAQSGSEVILRDGPTVDAVLASAAIPGVFPPVEVDGRLLFDGGVANNTPISTAIDLGATEVYVLSTAYSCDLAEAPTNPVALAMHGVALLVQQRLILEVRDRDYPVPVHMIPPPCPINVNPIDFSQTSELIERSRLGTRQWLTNGCPHAQPLGVGHSH